MTKRDERRVIRWNGRNPIGVAVLCKMDSGEIRLTKTRSFAFMANSGDPVIFLEGIAGYYLLTRVEVVKP